MTFEYYQNLYMYIGIDSPPFDRLPYKGRGFFLIDSFYQDRFAAEKSDKNFAKLFSFSIEVIMLNVFVMIASYNSIISSTIGM